MELTVGAQLGGDAFFNIYTSRGFRLGVMYLK